MPSGAAAVAANGDVVLIAPGEYYDCAVWHTDRLTVAGSGPGVVITDAVCQGKAVFVVKGDGVTVRDLTLARARTAEGNGAGIRAEGRTLEVERVLFRDDQVGILSGLTGPGAISLLDCRFEDSGRGQDGRLPAVVVGGIDLLQITGSVFKASRGGQLDSAAGRTVLRANLIEQDGPGAPPAATVARGALLAEDNTFRFATTAGTRAAMLAMGTDAPVLRRNRLTGDGAHGASLLVNWTGEAGALDGNTVEAGADLVTTRGAWRHGASRVAHGIWDALHAAAGRAKHALTRALGP